MYSHRVNGVAGGASGSTRPKMSITAPFKSQEVAFGSLIKVHVTHISNPERFQVQLDSSSDTLVKLMDTIHAVYGDIGPNDLAMKSFAVGQACIALFDEDSSWYRAKVTGLSGDNLVEVFFVDYGNTEFVEPHKVKAITPDLLDLPAQALTCSLSGVAPTMGYWSPEHTAQFEDIALDQSFTACFRSKREDHILLVKLIAESGELINQSFGKKTNSICPEEDSLLANRQIQIDNAGDRLRVTVTQNQNQNQTHAARNSGDASSNSRLNSTVDMLEGNTYDISVIFANSPYQFWCQVLKFDEQLHFISERLNAEYDNMPESANILRNPSPGAVCAAKFTEDNVWYRATISSVDVNSARVLFVDFGNSETVSFDLLKVLVPDLRTLPFLAFECILGNVQPANKEWTEEALEEFECLIYDKEMEAKVIAKQNGVSIVTLTDSVEGTDIGEKLISGKFAVSSQIGEAVSPYSKLNIGIPCKTQVFLSWVENPGYFWIQLSDNQTTLDDLTENLQNYCASGGSPSKNVKPGSSVLAKFTEDDAWYRGTVQLLTGSSATVLFVDYGNTDTLPISSLLSVPPEYLNTQSLAVLCKLNNIQPPATSKSWIVDAKDFLEDITGDGATAKFVDKDGDCYVVELFVGEENVEDKLVSVGVARKKSGSSHNNHAQSGSAPVGSFPNSITVSPRQSEQIYVSHVDTVSQFWCQLSKNTTDIDELMEKLETCYSQGQGKIIMSPSLSIPCAAKYSADEAWYRAKILQVDSQSVEVCFVDYGNCDTVNSSNVCELKPEFLALPTQAFHCRFQIDSTDTALADRLNEIVEEKELTMKVVSLSNGIHTVDLIDEGQSVTDMLSSAVLPRAPVLPPPRVQFKAASVPIGKPVQAFTSCVVSPGKLYLQMAGTEDQLATISEKLKTYCSASEIVPEIQDGDGCAALFAEDSEWYRAKVMSIRDSEVKVLFIDYGNAEYQQKEGLRPLPPDVLDIQPLSIECSLDDLAPANGSDWTEGSTEFLETIILDHELNCGFVSSAAVIITIDGEDVGDKLVDAGHAKRISAPPVPKEYQYAPKPPADVKGFITHIDANGIFYVQLSSTEQEIIKLAKLMQTEGKSASKLRSSIKVEKGLACVAKYNVDKNWYRVFVESVNEASVMCRFIDYGNCEEIKTCDLKAPTAEVMKAPIQALPCKLKDVAEWNNDLQERLNEMTDELTFTFLSDESPYDVLTKTKRGKDVADLLVNPPRPRVYAKQIKPTDDVQAFISHVGTDNSFYIQLSSDTDTINELSTKLADFPVDEVPEKLKHGYACASMFSEDQMWYRANVVKVGPKVQVHFVDFGNGDTVPVDKLKEQPEDLLDVPPFAFHCRLSGIDSWSQAAKELFDSFTENEMTVSFLSDASPYLVSMTHENREVSKQLLRAEVKSYPQQKTDSQSVTASICHTEKDGRFFLHLNKNADILDNIGADLQEFYASESSEVAYDLQKGQPCCAKFSEDKAWYRAVVEEVTEENAKVHFVDFGNTENVSLIDVKFMEKKFVQHPALAYECRLNEAGKWTEKKQQKFTEMTDGKELNVQFVTNTIPYMSIVTRSLADVLKEETDQSQSESPEDEDEDNNALLNFPPQTPAASDQCYVSHSEADAIFYIQLVSEEEKLTNLSEKLQADYSDSSKSLSEINVDSICIAKFTEDDMYYRASVEEVNGEEFKVRFVDYGNTDSVQSERIKKLGSKDVEIPPLAYKCRLHGLSQWTEDIATEFENTTADQTLNVKFVTTEPEFNVELALEDGSDILFILSGEKANAPESEQAGHPEKESELVAESESTAAESEMVKNDQEDDDNEDVVDGKIQGRSAEAESSLLTSTKTESNKTENENTEAESESGNQTVNDEAEGTVGSKTESSISINAELTEDDNLNCENESKDMNEDAEGSEHHDSGLVESIAETESSAKDESESSTLKELTEETSTLLESSIPNGELVDIETEATFKSEKLKEGIRLGVIVTHCTSPSDFYIQVKDSLKSFEKLTSEMYDYYNSLTEDEGLVTSPFINQSVAVLYMEDETWCRARIEEIQEDTCNIFYVDHGNTENVQTSSLRKLCLRFCELPIQTIECTLAGVKPSTEEWSEEAVQEFSELTHNKSLVADVINVGSGGNCLVHLLNCGISVSQVLIDKSHANTAATPVSICKKIKRVFSDAQSPAKRIKMALLDSTLDDSMDHDQILRCISEEFHQHESIHAITCHIESPSSFWCHFTFAADALKTQMEKLQTAYNSDKEKYNLDDLSTGDIGVIQSSDSKYYRASVLAINDKELTVRLVDYGRSEIVTNDTFWCLKDEFYPFPSQAARCTLHDILPKDETWDDASIERFSKLVEGQEKKVIVKYVSPKVLAVDLFDNVGNSVSVSMIEENLAVHNEDSILVCDDPELVKFGLDIPQINIFDDSVIDAKKDYCDLDFDTEYPIVVEHESAQPDFFAATLVYDGKSQKLMEDIPTLLKNLEDESDWEVTTDRPCLVLQDDTEWVRCRVVKINEDIVSVFCVDNGENFDVQIKKCASLPEEYFKIPPKSFGCCLGEITPIGQEWSAEAVQYVKDYMKGKDLSAYIIEKNDAGFYEVSVTDASEIDAETLNRLLIEQGHAKVKVNSQLEVQLQMENDLNDTDKMGELEASFHDVSFLRDNSIDESEEKEIDGLDETCRTINTTGHSIRLHDITTNGLNDLTLETDSVHDENEKERKRKPEKQNYDSSPTESDQIEADECENKTSDTEVQENETEADPGTKDSETEADQDELEAKECTTADNKSENEAITSESEADKIEINPKSTTMDNQNKKEANDSESETELFEDAKENDTEADKVEAEANICTKSETETKKSEIETKESDTEATGSETEDDKVEKEAKESDTEARAKLEDSEQSS